LIELKKYKKIKIIFIKDSAKHNILIFLFLNIKFSLKITTYCVMSGDLTTIVGYCTIKT